MKQWRLAIAAGVAAATVADTAADCLVTTDGATAARVTVVVDRCKLAAVHKVHVATAGAVATRARRVAVQSAAVRLAA